MSTQVIVLNNPNAGDVPDKIVIVELQSGDQKITLGGLNSGEQNTYTVYPGTSLVITEKEKPQ